jgi:hypothetical protein
MLLKRFADANEKIVMVSRQAPAKAIITKAATACAEVGFYAIDTDDVEDTHRAGHDPEGVIYAWWSCAGNHWPAAEG